MRRKKKDLHARVNGNLEIDFTSERLTSHGGLELMIRYLRMIRWSDQLRRRLGRWVSGGDYGTAGMCQAILGLLILGGRRLRHLSFLRGDPLMQRFCALKDLPSDRSASRFLKRFTAPSEEALKRLNADVVARGVRQLRARTLTIDVDGTVLSTGLKAGGAARGYNPHRRKVPSYFPITAYLADSGHFLRLDNRPGNVHDGAASVDFLKSVFTQVEDTLPRANRLRLRMDGAFFNARVLDELDKHKASYAVKVPFWQGLDLKGQIAGQRRWRRVEEGTDAFATTVTVKKWKRTFRAIVFRKKVMHPTRKNYQLNLFDPGDGTFEYSAVATNLSLGARALWRFMGGRGLHEKAIGELKSNLAFDTIPTKDYRANGAWQQFALLACNLLANFQIETGLAQRNRTLKCTARWALQSARTLRFELFNRAGRLVRTGGKNTLRLERNEQVESRFRQINAYLRLAV